MKNLLALLGLSVVVLGGVGYHQGWYKLTVDKNADGTLRVQTDVNTARASEDIHFWGHNLGEWIKNKSANTVPASTPGPQSVPTISTPEPMSSKAPLKEGAGWLMGNILGSKGS